MTKRTENPFSAAEIVNIAEAIAINLGGSWKKEAEARKWRNERISMK